MIALSSQTILNTSTIKYSSDIAYLHGSPFNAPEDKKINATKEIQVLYGATVKSKSRIITANLTSTNLNMVLNKNVKCIHLACSDMDDAKTFICEEEDGSIKYIKIEEIVNYFKSSNNYVQLVFISCCNSLELGKKLVELNIPHVVVIPGKVLDKVAIEFTHFFYSSLCIANTIKSALDHANTSLRLSENEKFLLLPQTSLHDQILFPSRTMEN